MTQRQNQRPTADDNGVIQDRTQPIMPKGHNAPGYAGKPVKRFNELDVNILENTADIELEEVAMRLEIRMNKLSKEIDLINDQINLYSIIKPKDRMDKLKELLIEQDEKEKELEAIKLEYQKLGKFYKFSDKMSDTLEQVYKKFKENKSVFSQTKLGQWSFGIIPFLRSRSYLLGTLDKLNTLYNKMEHIVNLKHIPYGEKDETTKDLIEFMRTANQLEARMNSFFWMKKNNQL